MIMPDPTPRDLCDSLDRYVELEEACARTPHGALNSIPLSSLTDAPDVVFSRHPRDHLLVWHRDLCWSLANEQIQGSDQTNVSEACYGLSLALGEIPRDTVYTYASRCFSLAPRTFSGTEEEVRFVLGLQRGAHSLLAATANAVRFSLTRESRYAAGIVEQVHAINKILSEVIKGVPVAIFVASIEPHFQRRVIRAETYYGPTAGQLPLVALESLLHGRSASQALRGHAVFQRPYLPPALRAVVDYGLKSTGIIGELPEAERRAIHQSLDRFRRVHFAIAKKAFALQAQPSQKARAILEALMDHDSRAP